MFKSGACGPDQAALGFRWPRCILDAIDTSCSLLEALEPVSAEKAPPAFGRRLPKQEGQTQDLISAHAAAGLGH